MSSAGSGAAYSASHAQSAVESTVELAARMNREANNGIGNWLGGLVSGKGSSPSQIIVTGILGLVPGLGQAMDARDLVFCIILVSRSPAATGGWVELVITLIGCVPAAGDALKVGFKLMKDGKSFGRALEGVTPKLRGNVEKYLREINWKTLASECKELLDKAFAAFIDGLDNWAVRALTSRAQVKNIIGELKSLRQLAPKMIDDVFAELKTLHTSVMKHELPGTTAALAGARGKTVRAEGQEAASAAASREVSALAKKERKLLPKKSRDTKDNHVLVDKANVDTRKAAQKNRDRNKKAIIAEHLTDYYVKDKYSAFAKANNHGKLIEEKSVAHTGIDHLWANPADIAKPFVVADTKSSIFDAFKLMAALPKELQEKFNVLKADEAANPLKNRKPNIFDSEARDTLANHDVEIGGSNDHDAAVRRGLNPPGKNKRGEPTGLPPQMTHAWIAHVLPKENLTPQGEKLSLLIEIFEEDILLNPNTKHPYQRWISLVTGRQLSKHKKAGGAKHEIQLMLNLPDNILAK
ncbi:hypothetical protein [Janthinobacterium sp. NKUCC06_STL]|uniref:hypothetical protein n=1 Tax=Janthinobacterium sp. NKUCC06_STL TaxID=2842127 RepID=UPI001C5B3C8B|nr:hypothetical protein [Janthinobacterium sp. NKUCC06_STL]MBW3512391.1 hypothetical protein [Janthinobacterium sp. NKUCC06_STL]